MKNLVFLFVCLLFFISCGDDKLRNAINNHEKNRKENLDTNSKYDKEIDSLKNLPMNKLENTTEEHTKDTIVEVNIPEVKESYYSPKFKKGVETTIVNIIKKKYKLSEAAEQIILQSLMSDMNIIKDVDVNIEEHIKITVGELERQGILVTVDINSPVDISHKYKHLIVKSKDTICLKTK